jgi:hypothetical protein
LDVRRHPITTLTHAVNSNVKASEWVAFVAARPEVPFGPRLLPSFNAGRITRLCDCGCNSFDIEVPDSADVDPIVESGLKGYVFQLGFRTPEELRSVEFTVYADERGHLSGLDVDYCGNAYPMPEDPTLLEPPYHVYDPILESRRRHGRTGDA